MSLATAVGNLLFGKQRREKAREERRRKTLREFSRRRVFEPLEDRQLLDAASLYETLPAEITIAEAGSYHYAYEGKATEFVDTSSVDGLTASFIDGDQVAFTVLKTSTDGAVTSLGEVVIQLFQAEGEAPNSSSQFLSLVYSDYYEGKTIHRIISDFMFQGGSSDGYGYEGSGTTIADEYSDVLQQNKRGMVAFANKGSDTSDAQFYVTFDATSWLDGSYNVFGYVVDGYDVLEQLENAEVTTNPKTSEASYPVDTYTISNVYVISSENATQSALRIVADEDASGVTTLSYTSQLADDSYDFQETKVYVGQEGLEEYVKAALADTNFEITAGETIDVTLPTEFGGQAVTYTVTAATDPEGYSITYNKTDNSDFSVVTTKAGAQYTTLSIAAKTANGLTATVEQAIYVSPSTPTVSLESNTDVKVGAIEGGAYLISSDLGDEALTIKVSYSGLDQGATTEAPLSVFVDDSEYAYTVESHTYDEETQIHTYTLALTLGSSDKLSEGTHSVKVREYLPIDRVTSHERLYSEFVDFDVLVDTVPLAFPEASTVIDITAGESNVLQLTTNKADEYGVNRSDVKFSLADPDAGPRFISLTEDGVFEWSDVTAEDAGVYYVNVVATDALGAAATKKLTLNVGFVPVIGDLTDLTVTTGETFTTKVVATVPTSESTTIKMKYELVDNTIDGLTIDESTGEVSWTVAEGYIASTDVKNQETSFTVKATSQILQDDGTYADGSDTQKTFALNVENSLYDATTATAPTIAALDDLSVEPGDLITVQVVATVPDEYAGVKYDLTSAPSGMTIDASTGEIKWDVPEDYFAKATTKSEDLTISVMAKTIVSSEDNTKDYGASTTTSFTLTVTNSKYEPTSIGSWSEWVDAWVENAQARYDGHAANLADYLDAYLKAVDARTQSLAEAKANYVSGETTLSEFLTERKEIVSDFNQTVADAREALSEADAQVDADCDARQEELNNANEDLTANSEQVKPTKVEETAQKSAQQATKALVSKSTGNARFRISHVNGAAVATDLASVLKLWRQGYSYNTIYDSVYSDVTFTATAGEETSDSDSSSTDSTTDDSTTTDDTATDSTTTDSSTTSDSSETASDDSSTTSDSSETASTDDESEAEAEA